MTESDLVTLMVGRFPRLVARGLADVLNEDSGLRVLALDLDASELECRVAREAPRVALVDDTVEYALLARLKACQPELGLLVLAHDPTPLYGALLLAAGVTFLDRDASDTDVSKAIRAAAHGEPTFLSGTGDCIVPRGSTEGLLTPREAEVFGHLSRGSSYVRIGHALHITPETVRTHTLSIRRKLDVSSKRELIGMSMPEVPLPTGARRAGR